MTKSEIKVVELLLPWEIITEMQKDSCDGTVKYVTDDKCVRDLVIQREVGFLHLTWRGNFAAEKESLRICIQEYEKCQQMNSSPTMELTEMTMIESEDESSQIFANPIQYIHHSAKPSRLRDVSVQKLLTGLDVERRTVERPKRMKRRPDDSYHSFGDEYVEDRVDDVDETEKPIIDLLENHYTQLTVNEGQIGLQCNECMVILATERRFRFHMKRHGGFYKWACPRCDYKTAFESLIRRHLTNRACASLEQAAEPEVESSVDFMYELKHPTIQLIPTDDTEHIDCRLRKLAKNYKFIISDYCDVVDNAFQCKLCAEKFRKRNRFMSHLHVQHPECKPYRCLLCNFKTRSKPNVFTHNRKHVRDKKFVCQLCGKAFAIKYKLTVHTRSHANDRQFPCSRCDARFNSNGDLARHCERLHPTNAPLACSCGKVFRHEQAYKRHQATHIPGKRFKCTYCQKFYRSRASLRIHMQSHTTVFKCQICNKSIMSYSAFVVHKNLHDPSNRKHACKVCHKILPSRKMQERHTILKHSSDKPYACDQCEKSFKLLDQLTMHKLCHTKEKRFQCDVCGATYKRQSSLCVHKKLHGDASVKPPFVCDFCGREFKFYQQLTQHLAHDEKAGLCPFCGRMFSSKALLEQHVISAHNVAGRDYFCVKCGLGCNTHEELSAHLMDAHAPNDGGGVIELTANQNTENIGAEIVISHSTDVTSDPIGQEYVHNVIDQSEMDAIRPQDGIGYSQIAAVAGGNMDSVAVSEAVIGQGQSITIGQDSFSSVIGQNNILETAIGQIGERVMGDDVSQSLIARSRSIEALIGQTQSIETVIGHDQPFQAIIGHTQPIGSVIGQNVSIGTVIGQNVSTGTMIGQNESVSTVISQNESIGTMIGQNEPIADMIGQNESIGTVIGQNESLGPVIGQNESIGTVIGHIPQSESLIGQQDSFVIGHEGMALVEPSMIGQAAQVVDLSVWQNVTITDSTGERRTVPVLQLPDSSFVLHQQ